MNLFDFLYRGATVYVAAGQIYAEAESNASLLAIAEAQQYMRPSWAELRRSREQIKCLFALPLAQFGDIPRHGLGLHVILTYKTHLD